MDKRISIKAKLALEDGTVFDGINFGAAGERSGEVVFNTAMTGYQEILTDPSYTGQLVCMTYPLIGNYGVNAQDIESPEPKAEGFIIRELSPMTSNFRAVEDLHSYLARYGVVGIEGVDTRALTRHIRDAGAMRCVLSTEDLDNDSLVAKARAIPEMVGSDFVAKVTPDEVVENAQADKGSFFHNPFESENGKELFHVVAIDCGMKTNIVRLLQSCGCKVTVVPASTSAEEILKMKADGVFVSNGPGDPEPIEYAIESLKVLVNKLPVFGICLGHQLLSLALGAKTYKMKFGHHGANHPVMRLSDRTIEITSQNHGFAVDPDSMDVAGLEITHVNLNDNTVEGVRHKTLPVYSVQYHPEAAPGPHDSNYLFADFLTAMKNRR